MPHYGRWTVQVTATDSAGNTTTRDDAGTLDFTLRPEEIDGTGGAQLDFSPASITAPTGRSA